MLHDENEFVKGLESLINRHCQENASNTPDFILAQFLAECLKAWNTTAQQRETWYGRDPRPICGELYVIKEALGDPDQ